MSQQQNDGAPLGPPRASRGPAGQMSQQQNDAMGAPSSRSKNPWVEDVAEFHETCGAYSASSPGLPPQDVVSLRESLIEEECSRELLPAMREGDLAKVADAIIDSIVVLIGTGLAYGLPLEELWDEVHRTNMAKQGGPRREDGKILKPPGWTPPDIEGVLARHRPGTL